MTHAIALPRIIQGGMGIGVSNWTLARAVSRVGQLGVVSGTAIDSLLVRRLQDGDPGGHVRRAMEAFPMPDVVDRVLKRFFLPEGRAEETPYRGLPMYRQTVTRFKQQVTILANFVEVFLAKEGHDGIVGINLLTKVQMPNLPSLYGAMLAGVDFVLMGAGIPREIPGALDRMAEHTPAAMKLDIVGKGEGATLEFDPGEYWDETPPALERPRFLPIVASNSLATMLARKANGHVDGFVIEGPTAGGHNAPPRGDTRYNDRGEPLYGERDVVDLRRIADLGLPFWVAGGAGRPGALEEVEAAGGTGIQVGTLFAFAEESGLDDRYRRRVLEQCREGRTDVITDDRASPTGFPFKVVSMPGSLSEQGVYEGRKRVCDLGYLRVAYRRDDGRLDYRCSAEPVDTYVAKGGEIEQTEGRRCLCNALMANIGYGQVRDGGVVEPPLLTVGDDAKAMGTFLGDRSTYTAADVIDYLLREVRGGVDDPGLRAPVLPVAGSPEPHSLRAPTKSPTR